MIEGTDKQDEVILISGHLDSAVSSKGAVDDAGAIGTVMALAEKYKALSDKGVRTHRTLYFACWSDLNLVCTEANTFCSKTRTFTNV